MFLIKNWKLVTITILTIALILSIMTVRDRNNDIGMLRTTNELEVLELKSEHLRVTREMERIHYEKQIKAFNDYKEREKVILADASSANDAVNRLSNTINEISTAAKLDAKLRDRYIDTTSIILKECTSEYSKLGEVTDRLNNELRLLSESNRRG